MGPDTDANASPSVPPTTSLDAAPQDTTSLSTDRASTIDKAELLRQIEYYFSDENLKSDEHLLGKLEEGNGTVSISQFTGWPRMRKYRPLAAVRDILRESTVIEVIDNKRIKRRVPFDMAKAKVAPKIREDEIRAQQQKATLKANPHLSKSMLKRTGFEHDHVEPSITPEEQQAELEQYSTEHSICDRIETAVLRYKMNRKFHQETLRMFHAYLNFGGFDEHPPMFTGGMSKEEEEVLSKEEKARRKQVNYVSKDVIGSIDDADGKWIVDFEGVTKGFFSTYFPEQFLWHDDLEHDREVTKAACNVLRNFFNYLLYHNACAEYTDQIHAARDVLQVVESEYLQLASVQQVFPGAFSIACSTLLDGHYAKTQYKGTWMDEDKVTNSKVGFTTQEANWAVKAGIAAFYDVDQTDAILSNSKTLQIMYSKDEVGLEVTAIILPSETSEGAQEFFAKLKGTMVPMMGKLVCKRYHFAKAAPRDLPPDSLPNTDIFEFVFDEAALQKCFVGMKFVAAVSTLTSGFHFIDHWSECYGTFYTWCWNEKAKVCKERNDPYELAKVKLPVIYENAVPMGEDKMLEYEGLLSKDVVESQSSGAEGKVALPSGVNGSGGGGQDGVGSTGIDKQAGEVKAHGGGGGCSGGQMTATGDSAEDGDDNNVTEAMEAVEGDEGFFSDEDFDDDSDADD